MTHEIYMKEALRLAEQARGYTSPNPMVGAVIVKNNHIIGRGFHKKAGTPHAEVYALQEAGLEAEGATLYVTLEPCCHHGKTPPCVDLIIQSGVCCVYIAMIDPNPLVSGQGITKLREAGIEVHIGLLEKEAQKLNEPFLSYLRGNNPFIVLKWAMTLDGKIATAKGESKWITTEEARNFGHELRATYDAMLVGIGTILIDDPELTCRLDGKSDFCNTIDGSIPHQPDCIILDSRGRTPSNAAIFSCSTRKVHIFVSPTCKESEKYRLHQAGASVHVLPHSKKGLSIEAVLQKAKGLGYSSILIEGGSQILSAFVEAKKVDKIYAFLGPLVLGGKNSKPAVGGLGFDSLSEALQLSYDEIFFKGNNIVIAAKPKGGS